MSINVASSCKQFLDICRKSNKAVVHLWQEGALFLVTCEATFFSPKRPICGHSHSGGNFLLAHCLSSGKRIGNMSARFYMRECVAGFWGVLQSSSSEFSVKSFVMKRTKGRSWSGMLLSRVHNLHSLYSRGIFLRRLILVFAFFISLVNFITKWKTRMKHFFKLNWTEIWYGKW